MFTALEYIALNKYMLLGYTPPVFLEALYIKPPFPFPFKELPSCCHPRLLLSISSLKKLFILEFSAFLFGLSAPSSVGGQVQDTFKKFSQH